MKKITSINRKIVLLKNNNQDLKIDYDIS